jgi:hypothetical protein
MALLIRIALVVDGGVDHSVQTEDNQFIYLRRIQFTPIQDASEYLEVLV